MGAAKRTVPKKQVVGQGVQPSGQRRLYSQEKDIPGLPVQMDREISIGFNILMYNLEQ